MDLMTYLYDRIDEELEDAHGYIEHAIKTRESSPDASKLMAQVSADELGHAQNLQSLAAKMPTDAQMRGVHDWLKGKFAERMANIKKLHDVYNGR